ncbi:unnamed protein product [Blepharisma stoltei]|uniref:Cyclic nucleotide-binding domain-containing protein n=1 Tax=Blepharisma stoltei TaxID=1481888 RepID=A0AAU9J6U6_9CILI|nr:unnamed protein product [Blepharisma stoltei]
MSHERRHSISLLLSKVNPIPEGSILQLLVPLLLTPPYQRTPKQISTLQNLTKNIKFFIKQIEERGDEIHSQICQFIGYEFISAGDYVCHFGETGSKFYIIIDGSVRVLTPAKLNEPDSNLLEVAQLHSGMAFGELALIKNQPRAATIQCISNCFLAVLEKEDYLRILGKAEARKLDHLIDFLQSLPLFRKWNKRSLARLTYYFKPKQYKRKNIVYKQGDHADYVYIVKWGEFELFKKIGLPVSEKITYNKQGLQRKEMINSPHKFEAKIAILATGEIFGDEEILNDTVRQCSCTCHSSIAEVLAISRSDFYTRIKAEESVKYLMSRIILKESSRPNVLENIDFLNEIRPASRREKIIRSITPAPGSINESYRDNQKVNITYDHTKIRIRTPTPSPSPCPEKKRKSIKPMTLLEYKRLKEEAIAESKTAQNFLPRKNAGRRTPSLERIYAKDSSPVSFIKHNNFDVEFKRKIPVKSGGFFIGKPKPSYPPSATNFLHL